MKGNTTVFAILHQLGKSEIEAMIHFVLMVNECHFQLLSTMFDGHICLLVVGTVTDGCLLVVGTVTDGKRTLGK